MATNKAEMEKREDNLKHLGFVRVLAINTAVLVSNLYDYAKQNSGPLRSTVGTVENAVTTIVRPVYERFKGVPDEVLVFLDKKVDDGTTKFDEHAPPFAKRVVSEVQFLFQKASEVAQDLSKDIQVAGPRAAVYHTGELSKQFATSQVAVLWYHVNHCPPLHAIAQMAAPTVAHWSEKYNQLVASLREKGYSIVSYIPSIPVEEISKAYKQCMTNLKATWVYVCCCQSTDLLDSNVCCCIQYNGHKRHEARHWIPQEIWESTYWNLSLFGTLTRWSSVFIAYASNRKSSSWEKASGVLAIKFSGMSMYTNNLGWTYIPLFHK